MHAETSYAQHLEPRLFEKLLDQTIYVIGKRRCEGELSGPVFLQGLDSCRLGGLNEVIVVLLMAAKFGVPVCPHAGGVGLCEYVQHISLFDYICVSASLENRVLEYVDHLHEHFVDPVVIRNGRYMPPERPGYSIEMLAGSLDQYDFPEGPAWQA